ncbi:WecB/TagA/CpsF family glycosyltransferase [Candidatus Woesebacteria bacterium]|nr:WecB/TagA/CpsF family glycosyltransferase [Candidatus Woesebacteria bacterium]
MLQTQLKTPQGVTSIFTPNPEQVMMAVSKPDFSRILRQASVRIPDGFGLLLASRVLSGASRTQTHISERIAGVDLAESLIIQATKAGKKCLVIGGKDYAGAQFDGLEFREFTHSVTKKEVSEMSANSMWWLSGYKSVKKPTSTEEKLVSKALSTVKPDVVFVAFGAPAQEEWVVSHLEELEKHKVAIVMVVGGAFDMLLGKVARAPEYLQKLGLEWLFRLIQEPWRWKRQLKLLEFTKLVIREALGFQK